MSVENGSCVENAAGDAGRRVLFITHAGPKIGGGHLSRCCALAQAFEANGFACSWVLNRESQAQAEKFGLRDVVYVGDPFQVDEFRGALPHTPPRELAPLEPFSRAAFAVVDTYVADEFFYKAIAEKFRLIAIADYADTPSERYASFLIDYSLGADEKKYRAYPGCKYLLGPKYALLRKEFWGEGDAETRNDGYILFAPGAADVANAAADVVSQWRNDWPELVVVLGGYVPEERAARVRYMATGRGGILVLVNPENFVDLMARADTVICTASVTAYEALALGKRVFTFSVALNQELSKNDTNGVSLGEYIGRWGNFSGEEFAKMILERRLSASEKSPLSVARNGALRAVRDILNKGVN